MSQGEVFDVAVDLRRSSPTFGQLVGVVLTAENKRRLWIPLGFAHGFLVTSETAEFLYKTNDYWYSEHERSWRWNNPTVVIEWHLQNQLLLATKDALGKMLGDSDRFD